MTIQREDVERIARLAALGVDEADLPTLTAQLTRILEYVSQIGALVNAGAPALTTQQEGQPLRQDGILPADLQAELSTFAPHLKDGLFLVPRLPAMEDE